MRTRWLIVLLLAIPLADALFLVVVADAVGWQITVALVVLTALVGTLLVRAEGRHTLRKIQRRLQQGQIPTDELLDGAFLIAAGAFLLTPGLVTDTIGFLLAVPLSRLPIREALKRALVKPYLERKTDGFLSGAVWTDGFPGPDGGPSSPGNGDSGPDSQGGFSAQMGFGGDSGFGGEEFDEEPGEETYDVDPEKYTFEDRQDSES
jgi:UPF0716 protein FxsA